jgi:predicted HicB family RNase H-like nuclease
MLSYQGYNAALEIDEESGLLVGEVLDISNVLTFEGETFKKAVLEFHRTIDIYLKTCKQKGLTPEKPFSGKLPFRTKPEIHQGLFLAAQASKSINTWMEDILRQAANYQLNPNQTGIYQPAYLSHAFAADNTVEVGAASLRQIIRHTLAASEQTDSGLKKSFLGKLPFRTKPEIHRSIYLAAHQSKKSINAWMETVLVWAVIHHLSNQLSGSTEERDQLPSSPKQGLKDVDKRERLMDEIISALNQKESLNTYQLWLAIEAFLEGVDGIKACLKDPGQISDLMSIILRSADLEYTLLPPKELLVQPQTAFKKRQ